MALTSTLFTGLSGLEVNQTRLNVVGNNIANVNTVAFKRSRALFKPQFYVTDQAGSPPNADFGGTNPSQRGLGAVVASIQKDFSAGAIEPTGKMTDMAIDGEGFFVVQGQQQRYTRDGSFTLNASNQLVTSTGEFVQGYAADEDGNVIPGALGELAVPIGAMTMARATENVQMIGNLNAGGNVASGASIVNSQAMQVVGGGTPTALTALTNVENAVTPGGALFAVGDVLTYTPKRGSADLPSQTYTVTGASTVGELADFMRMGAGIETDPAIPVPPGVPAPGMTLENVTGDPAGSVRLVMVGNSGASNALSMTGSRLLKQDNTSPFTFIDNGTNTAGQTSTAAGESQQTSFTAVDSLGNRVQVNLTAVMESKTTAGITWRFYATSPNDSNMTDAPAAGNRGIALGTGTLTFDNAGQLVASTGTTVTVDRAQTGAGTPISMAIDFGRITSLTDNTQSRLQTAYQDGLEIGELTGFSIGADGSIIGSFTNGLTRTLGQVAVAMFNNPSGLEDLGGNQFAAGANSGLAIVTSPMNLGAGAVRSGALELSNVDLSEEFINMIISTTGFSAASRVITTSDQLITELLNTSR